MKLQWICTVWGMEAVPARERVKRAKAAGFDGVETGVPVDAGERRELKKLLDDAGMLLVAQQWTAGADGAAHARSFEEQYRRSAEMGPLLVNSHTGRDIFSLKQNLEVFAAAGKLERELGIPVAHEVHRGRVTFSTLSTMALIDALPEVRLTADFSHWCCVHESLLEDQEESVKKAITHAFHVHARVGHAEAPQVTDPRAPEWKKEVDAHLKWWQSIVDARKAAGAGSLTICPEFGPPHYMATLPGTTTPVADQWAINSYMKDFLRERLVL
ncbi:MAG: sugar phosphate isomerase/epimerase family protein [Spirochaetia bacterium]